MNKPNLIPVWDKKEAVIQYIMDNFDFEKVHKYMVKHKWTWTKIGTPSIQDLELHTKKLMNDHWGSEKGTNNCRFGGFAWEFTPSWCMLKFSDSSWGIRSDDMDNKKRRSVNHEVCCISIGIPEIKIIKNKGRNYYICLSGVFYAANTRLTKKEAEAVKRWIGDNYYDFMRMGGWS